MQAFQSPNDTSDVSFLVETNDLEENEDHALREAFFRQQKTQLEEERQKLMDFATQLAKQASRIFRHSATALHFWSPPDYAYHIDGDI